MLTTPPPSWATWQRISNDVGVHAAERREPVPVVARVVWADDGEQHVDGLAVAWTRSEVLVEIDDRRCATAGAWLAVADVRRRSEPPPVMAVPTTAYRVERVAVDATAAEIARVINACSADGWRLVHMIGAAGIVLTFAQQE